MVIDIQRVIFFSIFLVIQFFLSLSFSETQVTTKSESQANDNDDEE